ncbi:hydroxypyruvate isomerase [Enterobacter sp. kpr-6]|uniref:hydroxypyruvate isomerase family protein n=1 Tax=Enterobacter sp. kpr-6 TaxID=1761782 RepID=UPI0008F02CE3|nr:TIM barrel protein [Enterobacter sp. kpr-6]SFR05986.1 hydroxypyruvate isomerase [Enterobacter sp. kpr-6]
MLRLAANLDWLYRDVPIDARFYAARDAGFHGVEGLFLWQHSLAQLCALSRETALPVALMNAPAGDWDQGERGLAALPGREADFRQSIAVAAEYARALNCSRIHVMSGLRLNEMPFDEQYALLITRLRNACDVFAAFNIEVVIEPLNSEDMPGYFVNSFLLAQNIIHDTARENIGLQFDIYHCQKMHGNVINNIRRYQAITRHYQIASVPGRNEPGSGELNDARILTLINQLDYQGWVGCEYHPSDSPSNMDWITPYL